VDLAEDPLLAFTTLSLSPTPEPGSPFHTIYSSGIFSLRESAYESATDIDSQNTESDDSASDARGINEVIHMLDIHLVSVLSGNLDLAARLIPKIHDLLDGEVAGNPAFLGSRNQDFFSHHGGEQSKGKQGTSGGTSSALTNRNAPSSSSPQKHGRGSGIQTDVGKATIPTRSPDESLIEIQAIAEIQCQMGIQLEPQAAIRLRIRAMTRVGLLGTIQILFLMGETLIILEKTPRQWTLQTSSLTLHAISISEITSNMAPGTRNMQCVLVPV